MQQPAKESRGGNRPGAGRPKKDKGKLKAFAFSVDVITILEAQPNMTEFLEQAARYYHQQQPV